jgi:UDP-N-acetylglucosamine 3-dehydrogenase
MKRVKIILFGFGNMGRNHARVISESADTELLAVVDPRAQGEVTSKGLKVLASADEALLAGADAYVVATSTETHFELLTRLIPLRKPILVEKPVCHELDQAHQLEELARSHGTPVRVGHLERLNPAVLKLKEVLSQGLVGKPIHFSFTRAGGYPSRIKAGNNVVVDLAVHDIDVFHFLVGPSHLVASITHRSMNPEFVDTAEMMLSSRAGASASLHVNWITPAKLRTLRVTGTRGVCQVDYILQTCVLSGGGLLQVDSGSRSDFRSLIEQYQSTDRIEFGVTKTEPLKVQLAQFVAMVNGSSDSLCSMKDSIAALEVAVSALERAQGGDQA